MTSKIPTRLPRVLIALQGKDLILETVTQAGTVIKHTLDRSDPGLAIDTIFAELEFRREKIDAEEALKAENEKRETLARKERIFADVYRKHGPKLAARVEPEIAASYVNGKKPAPKPVLTAADLDV